MYTSLTTILSTTALLAASLTSAAPAAASGPPSGWLTWAPPAAMCLTPQSAEYLVSGYSGLLTAYTTANAEKYLSDSFTDYSDSINFLTSTALGSVTFPNKQAFEQGQGTQPAIGFNVLNIDAITCDTIAFRWEAILGSGSPIKGINIMVASNSAGQPDTWQIETNYSEFNSATWAIEVGGSCSPPKQS